MSDTTDAISDTRAQFVRYMGEFLEALGDVYPQCKAIKELRLKYGIGIEHALTAELRVAAEREMLTEYHAAMVPYYHRVQARDDSVIAEAERTVSLLRDLQISAKWESADEDTRTCIYQYLDLLNRFSQMYAVYTSVPSGMMGKIQTAAHSIACQLDSGSADLSTLNLAQLGQNVVSQIPPEELQQFATGIMQHPERMSGIMNMMSAMAPAMAMPPGK